MQITKPYITVNYKTQLIHINIKLKNVFQQKTNVSVKKQCKSEHAVL